MSLRPRHRQDEARRVAMDAESARILDALCDAARISREDLGLSGILVRTPDVCVRMVSANAAQVTAQSVEIVHAFLLPALDSHRFAALLGMRVVERTDAVLRVEI